jgi:hypothetical protein
MRSSVADGSSDQSAHADGSLGRGRSYSAPGRQEPSPRSIGPRVSAWTCGALMRIRRCVSRSEGLRNGCSGSSPGPLHPGQLVAPLVFATEGIMLPHDVNHRRQSSPSRHPSASAADRLKPQLSRAWSRRGSGPGYLDRAGHVTEPGRWFARTERVPGERPARVVPVKIALAESTPLKFRQRVEIETLADEHG